MQITLVRRDERDFILKKKKTEQKEKIKRRKRRDLFENDNDPPPIIINMKRAQHNIMHQARASAQLFRPWRYI